MQRIKEVLDGSGKSLRTISLDAKLGQNFLSQMFTTGLEPTISNVIAILDNIDERSGEDWAIYVLTGIKLMPQTRDVLRMISSLDEDGIDDALRFFTRLQGLSNVEGPLASAK